ncbi:MAG: hypothetical protein WBX19_12195, partial [Terracidiphilus sp.]
AKGKLQHINASREWTVDAQQKQESKQHDVLYGDTAESAKNNSAGKLKRVSGQYQTYGINQMTVIRARAARCLLRLMQM